MSTPQNLLCSRNKLASYKSMNMGRKRVYALCAIEAANVCEKESVCVCVCVCVCAWRSMSWHCSRTWSDADCVFVFCFHLLPVSHAFVDAPESTVGEYRQLGRKDKGAVRHERIIVHCVNMSEVVRKCTKYY